MKYEFDRLVSRKHLGSLKEALVPAGRTGSLPSFDGAEMDFPTAPSILQKLRELTDNGLFGYTLADEAYKRRVCWWMKAARQWEIDPEWIVPSPGTIHSVATAIRLLTEPGDGVLLQQPEYPRYEQAARRLGRKPVVCPLRLMGRQYEMDWNLLEARLKEAKLMVICNPHNPTGRVWTKEETGRLMELAKRQGVPVISDEIFAEVTWDGRRTEPCGDMIVTSLGKTFNLTGANHANVIIPDPELRQRWIQQRDADHFGSIDPWMYAAVQGAYNPEGLDWVRAMLTYVDENRQLILNRRLPGVQAVKPEGTYVVWLRMTGFASEEEQMTFLRQQAGIAATPGSEYGGSGWIRMNMATPHQIWKKAVAQLEQALGGGSR